MRFFRTLLAVSLSGVLAFPAVEDNLATDPDKILKALKEAEIISDAFEIKAVFQKKKGRSLGAPNQEPLTTDSVDSESSIDLGTKITPSAAQFQPLVTIIPLNQTALDHETVYTLAMTDPDAPSRKNPTFSEFLHWLATGVKVSSAVGDLQTSPTNGETPYRSVEAETLVDYKGPGPPPKTGYHRYVLVLLRPAVGAPPKSQGSLVVPPSRPMWGMNKPRHGVRQWAKQQGLEVVGANFFYSQNEEQ